MSISVFTLLGRVQYRVGGQLRADWPRQIRAFAGALLIQAGRPVPRTQLMDWIWGSDRDAPKDPAGTLSTYATRLRTILKKVDGDADLITESGTYRLAVSEKLVDYHAFRAAMERARGALGKDDPLEAYSVAFEAISLWQQEEPLFGIESQRARNWRRRVQTEELLPARDTMLSALVNLGRFTEAQRWLDEFLHEHPHYPGFIKLRMETLYRLGLFDESNRYFSHNRKRLLQQGDGTVADELLALHNRLIGRAQPSVAKRVPERRPRSLPRDVPGFVGRGALVDKMDAATSTHSTARKPGVIILHGQGGVGKTALALHWAHHLVPAAGELVFYHDLKGFDPEQQPLGTEDVVDELLAQLNFTDQQPFTPAQRARKLRELLAHQPAVIILDNVYNSDHVRGLLSSLGDATVVLTSRRRLTSLRSRFHAIELLVMPLSADDAVSFLVGSIGDRAVQAKGAIGRIVGLSDGLPLALQIIAGLVDRHSDQKLTAIVDELRDRTAILDIGDDGDSPPASLRACFALSYKKLSPDERKLYATLALHPGREITAAAAAALAGGEVATARRGLEALAGAHMIEDSTPGRFRFHDLLRVFGRECAEEFGIGHIEEASRRLLSWYLHTGHRANQLTVPHRTMPDLLPLVNGVRPVEFASPGEARTWLTREGTNLVDVVRWAADGFPDYAWRLPHLFYRALRREGRYFDAKIAFETAAVAAKRVGHPEGEGGSRHDLGQILLALGDRENASAQFHYASGIAQQINSAIGLIISWHALAGLDIDGGRFDEGMALYQRALDLARESNALESQTAILLKMGDAHEENGAKSKALPLLQEALWLSGGLHDSHARIKVLTSLVRVLIGFGDHAGAESYGAEALELVAEDQDHEEGPSVHIAVARVRLALDRNEEALDHARSAVNGAHGLGNAQVEADARYVLGLALFATGHADEAATEWTAARTHYLERGDRAKVQAIDQRLTSTSGSPIDVPGPRGDHSRAEADAINFHDLFPGQ